MLDVLRTRKVVIALEQPGHVHQILITGRLNLEKPIHHGTVPAVEGMLLLLARHWTSFSHSLPGHSLNLTPVLESPRTKGPAIAVGTPAWEAETLPMGDPLPAQG